jgi:hypothetical protein
MDVAVVAKNPSQFVSLSDRVHDNAPFIPSKH